MPTTYKVVLLGEGRVGKTSLTLRYVRNTFTDKQQATIQASFLNKRITMSDETINVAIWDTAGQERFHALGPIYYRDADGALLVYDITDPDSFTKVQMWVKELKKMVGGNIAICIAGNKIDLEKKRQVDKDEAERYASSVGAKHFGTSAKLNRGVEDAFLELTKAIKEQRSRSKSSASRGGGKLTVISDAKPTKSESKCC